MMDLKKLHYLSPAEANNLLANVKNQRHKIIVLLLVDCGLRVSECINLRYSNFDFKEKNLHVKSLKKRDKDVVRIIPLSNRLYSQIAIFLNHQKGVKADAFLFPNSKNPDFPISRFAVNKMLKRSQLKNPVTSTNLHPHTLRHTFATQHLSAGTPIENIKDMLGHSSLNTTLIYAHIPTENLRRNVEEVTNPKTKLQKLLVKLNPFKKRLPSTINLHFQNTGIPTVGRNLLVTQIADNAKRGINTIILGSIGIGKSHLIELVENIKDLKILKIEDSGELKTTLAQMLVYILKTDQEGVFNFLFPAYDYTQAVTKISRDTTQHIAKRIVEITPKKEYVLLIDNVDRITPKSAKILEIFKDHFTIITTAREVPINKSSFLWNFDIIKLKELDRDNAMKLIQAHSGGIQVEDYNLFRNHVYEQTNGNPRAIAEIIERYKKEPVITNQIIRQIRHTGALKEIDCTFLIILFLGCVSCLRYVNHEVSNASFKVLGGIAMVFLLISRYVWRFTTKKTI